MPGQDRMDSPTPQPPRDNPRESGDAALAFADFVDLGPGTRSVRALHAEYLRRQRSGDKPPTVRLRTIAGWSSTFHWQQRVRDAANERSRQKLEEAEELDADTFLTSSRLINERMHDATSENTDVVIKMRESVRKPLPKGGASVNVNVSVEVRHLAEQMAKSLGISAEELLEEAESIAATQWEKVA